MSIERKTGCLTAIPKALITSVKDSMLRESEIRLKSRGSVSGHKILDFENPGFKRDFLEEFFKRLNE